MLYYTCIIQHVNYITYENKYKAFLMFKGYKKKI